MKSGPFAFARTATFRLALIYTVLFALFSIGLIAFIYQATVGNMRSDAKSRLESEFRTLAVAYSTGGPLRLEQALIERALVEFRDLTYQFEDAEQDKIVGDLPRMPVAAPDEIGAPRVVHFEVESPQVDGAAVVTAMEGRIVRLADGSVLLVGIEMSERLAIAGRITRAVAISLPIAIVLSLVGGFFISRYAARRAETLNRTAEAVMAGDLSQRAPVLGSGDEFDRLAAGLNAMLARIESLMATTRHAGDAIAHDLRSPLSRLRNRLEAALRGPMDAASARETLAQTVDEVDRVLATFNAILRLANVSAGAEGRFVPLDASELAAEMAELFEPACEEAGLRFSAEIEKNLSVRGDQSLLAQALSNLLDNAMKYTPAGGAIAFHVRRSEADICFCVEDTGPGIPEADRQRVIQRFVRLDDARTQTGSGLGLSLVQAVAEQHQGRLVLERGSGADLLPGLRITLMVPRAK